MKNLPNISGLGGCLPGNNRDDSQDTVTHMSISESDVDVDDFIYATEELNGLEHRTNSYQEVMVERTGKKVSRNESNLSNLSTLTQRSIKSSESDDSRDVTRQSKVITVKVVTVVKIAMTVTLPQQVKKK